MSQAEFIGMMVICGSVLLGMVSLIVKPIKENTRAMVENTMQIKHLTKNQEDYEKHNHDNHKRLWDHEDEQDKLLDNHELRLHDLEGVKNVVSQLDGVMEPTVVVDYPTRSKVTIRNNMIKETATIDSDKIVI